MATAPCWAMALAIFFAASILVSIVWVVVAARRAPLKDDAR